MALPTITKMQKTAQEMLNKNKEQQAASTAAAQSGSTSTPTTASTPKVTQTAKAQPSVQQQTTTQPVATTSQPVDLTKINLFKPQEQIQTAQQIQQQYWNLMSTSQEKKDTQAWPIPWSVINAANTVWWETQTQVKKTVLQQFKDWFKRTDEKMQKSSEQFREKAWEDYYVWDFWKNLIWWETQAEEYIARLTDKLAGEWNEWYVEAFEKWQWEFWRQEIESYNKYVEAAKAWDISSQEFWKKVWEFMNKLSWWKWSGEWWAEFASSTASTLKDPRQFVGNLWNMLPWLVLSQAWWLWLWMAYWTAQQSEDVYEDFSTDEWITNNLNDNQIFLMSSWVWAVLSLVEWLWDILWDLPWAKTFSKNIRWTIGKILKKDISKTLVKDIEDSLEKDIKKEFRNPIKNAISKWFKWWLWELAEEPIQNEIQNEVAIWAGSNRQHYTLAQLATMWIVSFVYGSALQTIWLPVNIKQNQDLKNSYKEWSKEVDKVAPWLKEEVKENMFVSMVASQIRDTQLSDRKVNRYQKQAEELYNQKAELEQKLETTTDPWAKQTINNQIKDIDAKINDIDQKINQWENTVEEVNKQIEEFKEKQELPAQPSITKQEWWTNLSEQTMHITDNEVQSSRLQELTNTLTWLNKKSISKWKEKSFMKKLSWMSKDGKIAELAKYKTNDIMKIQSEAYDIIYWAYSPDISVQDAQDIVDAIKWISQYLSDLRTERDSLRGTAKPEETRTPEEYYVATWKPFTSFVKQDTQYSKHLVWLKDTSIKNLKWDITEETAKKFSLMLAKVSQILWIDFNKVINNVILNVTQNDNVTALWWKVTDSWFLTKDWTKEQLQELVDRLWERAKVEQWEMDEALDWIIRAWIYLAKSRLWEAEAVATLAHEFFHLLDYKLATDLWLPITQYTNWDWDIVRDWISAIEWDESWKTFKTNNNWTAKDIEYYNKYTEILSRYAEQYVLYRIAKEWDQKAKDTYDLYSNNARWYWTNEEFEKLIDKFENILTDAFWDYSLDEWNKFYYDIMVQLDNYRNTWELTRSETRLRQVEKDKPLATEELQNKMSQMQKEYVELKDQVDWLEWAISEEIKAEYDTMLSTLQSNIEMLERLKDEYLDMSNKKATEQEQESVDGAISPDNVQELVQDNKQENEDYDEWLLSPEITWPTNEEAFMTEAQRAKRIEKRNVFNDAKRTVWKFVKDIFTPAISRIYNISPRVAWRLTQMEAQSWVNVYRYTQQTKWFVDTMNKLKGKDKLEVTKALLDFWALAKEQTEENLQAYKDSERAKLRDTLKKYWFKDEDINNMFSVLNDLWTRYQEAWLTISLSDMYFPRVVKDYEWLIEYMSRVSWREIRPNTKSTMIDKIKAINEDTTLSQTEKDNKIRNVLTIEFRQPWTTSQHGKERKLWLLSEWWDWIYAYYEDPTISLAHYITTMENAIQRQNFLWWMKQQLWIEEETKTNDDSVSAIVSWLVEDWQIDENQAQELKRSILAVLNKKATPKVIWWIKDFTYITSITNFVSAINQLDDLAVVILKDKNWLKNIARNLFGKAGIKYDELWLESAYEMFKSEMWISDWLFAKSWFNAIDRFWKTSFIMTAWDSLVHQCQNEKTKEYLYGRLKAMYWEETANHIIEKAEANDYMTNWQIDIDVLTDLLYQLWSTQPVYTSAMPVEYLNRPISRLCYALSMFAVRRIDFLIQWTKEVYRKNGWWFKGTVAAWWWLMYVSAFLAMFSACVWDIWDALTWKKDETWLWHLLNWDREWAWKQLLDDMIQGWLKLWTLSKYDKQTYNTWWPWAVFTSKIEPYISQTSRKIKKSVKKAIEEEDVKELAPLLNYVPEVWKILYWWFKYYEEQAASWWDFESWEERDRWENDWSWWEEEERNRE